MLVLVSLELINNKHKCRQKFVLSTYENAIGTLKYTFTDADDLFGTKYYDNHLCKEQKIISL